MHRAAAEVHTQGRACEGRVLTINNVKTHLVSRHSDTYIIFIAAINVFTYHAFMYVDMQVGR